MAKLFMVAAWVLSLTAVSAAAWVFLPHIIMQAGTAAALCGVVFAWAHDAHWRRKQRLWQQRTFPRASRPRGRGSAEPK